MSNNTEFTASVKKATQEIINKLVNNVNKACLVVERDAKQLAGKNDGRLAGSIQSNVSVSANSIDGSTFTNLEYAPYHHNGTGIYAKDGNGRKTPWIYKHKSGKFVKTVGQRPNKFMEEARDKNLNNISNIIAGGN